MKLVSFRAGPAIRAGVLLDGGDIVDLQAVHAGRYSRPSDTLQSVLSIVAAGPEGLDMAAQMVRLAGPGHRLALAGTVLEAPIPQPPQMRDFLCFEKHLVQAFQQARQLRASRSPDPEAALRDMEAKGILAVPATWYERPIFYHPSRFSVCGSGADVHWPAYSQVMDFELEFGCYIGRTGRDIPASEAREHIFGYTIFNDFSARDEQTLEMPGQLGPGKGKDFDDSNAMGPCLVTADEIGDPYDLTMIARVNGEEWCRGHSGEMRWHFEDCIAHVSRSETLHPGEFFGSGTVGGGCGLEQLRFLASGDVVELEVEGIGILRNRVLGA
jgi:2-keto-4-pentenoate hydratase/2-oxohepta-3-ene-1,7-dioic acid hydratase in catechol pathway